MITLESLPRSSASHSVAIWAYAFVGRVAGYFAITKLRTQILGQSPGYYHRDHGRKRLDSQQDRSMRFAVSLRIERRLRHRGA